MPSFSRCRAGILLSHSVYTGITINPGVGEVDQHPRRTFNYQGTVAQEGKRQESFRRVRPVSFESPRYRRAISPFPVFSLSLALSYPSFLPSFYSCLPFRSTLCYFLSYGGTELSFTGRDRENRKIPEDSPLPKGQVSSAFFNAANFPRRWISAYLFQTVSLPARNVSYRAKGRKREGGGGGETLDTDPSGLR